jgi:intracellular sulfur oxidation DsrE/DsrF family protein
MKTPIQRRTFMQWLAAISCMTWASVPAHAEPVDRDLFGEPTHKVVYQLNRSDLEYIESILFSVGELLRKYGDDIHLVVTVIGPGIHILAKRPGRPVPELIRQRVSSLAAYGVSFHACGNTMKSLNWTREDILDFADIVEIGADDLMRLQEQGYSYISW